MDPDNLDRHKPTHREFRYQDYPFYWIARVASVYSQRMEEELKREGLNLTSWRVGMILRQHGSLSISEISRHAAIRLSTVTRCVYLMQERGWLSVRRSRSDARVTEARVTAAGLELIERLIARTSRGIQSRVSRRFCERTRRDERPVAAYQPQFVSRLLGFALMLPAHATSC